MVKYALAKLNDEKNCNKRRLAQESGVAAPVGGQIFSEVLPYLEVQKK